MRRLDLPRIGRYRLYDLLPAAHIRCRLCGARLRIESAWRHFETEARSRDPLSSSFGAFLIEDHIRLVLLRRRSARHRRHSQYEHETGGRYD